MVIADQRRADGAAGVAGGRLHPDAVELACAQDLAVGDAIERDAAGQAEIALAVLDRQAAGEAQHRLFQHGLDRRRDVHVLLRQRIALRTRRHPEQPIELLVRHGQAGAIIEIRHVELERAVRFQVDHVVQDEVAKMRLAVRRKPHQLVLPGIDPEPEIVGEGGVQEPEAVREMNFLEHVDRVAVPHAHHGGAPFADAVDGEHQSVVERGGVERAGGMRVMVLGEQQPLAIECGIDRLQRFDQHLLLEQLFAEPDRHRLDERSKPARRIGEIGFQQALEFQERLVVEHHMVRLAQRHARFVEAIPQRVRRKACVEFLAREALFLRRRRDLAVLDQRGCAVVIEGGESEDPHLAATRACVRS